MPVYLQADGTFGWDDPISWPQPYHADAPHLACVPISDSTPGSGVQMFQRGLRKDQVTFMDDWIEKLRVGKLSEDLVQELRLVVKRFLEDV